jgi:hypothetical protein
LQIGQAPLGIDHLSIELGGHSVDCEIAHREIGSQIGSPQASEIKVDWSIVEVQNHSPYVSLLIEGVECTSEGIPNGSCQANTVLIGGKVPIADIAPQDSVAHCSANGPDLDI